MKNIHGDISQTLRSLKPYVFPFAVLFIYELTKMINQTSKFISNITLNATDRFLCTVCIYDDILFIRKILE